MTKKTEVSISKPTFPAADALKFAAGNAQEGAGGVSKAAAGKDAASSNKTAQKAGKQTRSGLVPEGDVRMTANISTRHHIKLKVAAAEQQTTVGDLLEKLIDENL